MDGEKESRESMGSACHDDDDDIVLRKVHLHIEKAGKFFTHFVGKREPYIQSNMVCKTNFSIETINYRKFKIYQQKKLSTQKLTMYIPLC